MISNISFIEFERIRQDGCLRNYLMKIIGKEINTTNFSLKFNGMMWPSFIKQYSPCVVQTKVQMSFHVLHFMICQSAAASTSPPLPLMSNEMATYTNEWRK